jgi:hypothetical protein
MSRGMAKEKVKQARKKKKEHTAPPRRLIKFTLNGTLPYSCNSNSEYYIHLTRVLLYAFKPN